MIAERLMMAEMQILNETVRSPASKRAKCDQVAAIVPDLDRTHGSIALYCPKTK